MKHYVYALIDPTKANSPFYVGKGCGRRPDGHFRQAANAADASDATIVGHAGDAVLADVGGADDDPAKIDVLRNLIEGGHTPQGIVRIVARDVSDHTSKTLESFLISHAFGLGNLKNLVHGEHSERFRPAGDWRPIRNLDDEQIDGSYFVYVLRDPESGEVFYVGKGTANRISNHFRDAQRSRGRDDSTEKLDTIRGLLDRGLRQSDVARVIARLPAGQTSESDALDIESIGLKFVYGQLDRTNVVRGHHSGRFRAKADWELRPGFDLPYIVHEGGRVGREDDLHLLLGEGLDVLLMQVCSTAGGVDWSNPEILDSGELGREAAVGLVDGQAGAIVKVFIRSSRIQIEMRWRVKAQRQWIVTLFGRLNAYPLARRDDVFIPSAWRGAANMTADVLEAARRLRLMLKLSSVTSRDELSQDERDELLGGLPSGLE